MQKRYVLLVVVALMMLHGMVEQSAMTRDELAMQVDVIAEPAHENKQAMILVQDLKSRRF